jgi:hypothetical protein
MALQVWLDSGRVGHMLFEILYGDKEMVRGEHSLTGLTIFQFTYWHENCNQDGGSSVSHLYLPTGLLNC